MICGATANGDGLVNETPSSLARLSIQEFISNLILPPISVGIFSNATKSFKSAVSEKILT